MTDLAKMEAQCREIGEKIGCSIPDEDETGFALLLFSKGEGGWMTYTANCDRQDVCRAMSEFIDKAAAQDEHLGLPAMDASHQGWYTAPGQNLMLLLKTISARGRGAIKQFCLSQMDTKMIGEDESRVTDFRNLLESINTFERALDQLEKGT